MKEVSKMEKMIVFDMDGTIADFYGVSDWRECLDAEDEKPYKIAVPLLNMQALARKLNALRRDGWQVCICSWASKNASPEFFSRIEKAKKAWLDKHLRSVTFDRIDIIEYGTSKAEGREGILFDDNAEIRAEWGEGAFDVDDIMGVLRGL
jgi:FMN phosphatase YigB (HAD superfamily)